MEGESENFYGFSLINSTKKKVILSENVTQLRYEIKTTKINEEERRRDNTEFYLDFGKCLRFFRTLQQEDFAQEFFRSTTW